MSIGDEIQIRMDSQERQILTLRVRLEAALKRVAQKETYILKLERKLAVATHRKSPIDQVFNAIS